MQTILFLMVNSEDLDIRHEAFVRNPFIVHSIKSRNIPRHTKCNIQIYRSIPTITFEEERIDEQWVMVIQTNTPLQIIFGE